MFQFRESIKILSKRRRDDNLTKSQLIKKENNSKEAKRSKINSLRLNQAMTKQADTSIKFNVLSNESLPKQPSIYTSTDKHMIQEPINKSIGCNVVKFNALSSAHDDFKIKRGPSDSNNGEKKSTYQSALYSNVLKVKNCDKTDQKLDTHFETMTESHSISTDINTDSLRYELAQSQHLVENLEEELQNTRQQNIALNQELQQRDIVLLHLADRFCELHEKFQQLFTDFRKHINQITKPGKF